MGEWKRTLSNPAIIDDSRRWAKITGTRGPFVEFDFTVGDPDLTVELIMPYQAFVEFCRDNSVSVLPAVGDLAQAFERLKWRSGHGGQLPSSQRPS